MFKLLVIIGTFCVTSALGQTFENIRTRKDEDKIIVIYDLVSIDPGSKVKVSLFSSLDNYNLQLVDVTGDVGTVTPGPNKRIIWKVSAAVFQNFESISFRFNGENLIGWRILESTKNIFTRGKKNMIRWQGGEAGEQVNIELIHPGSKSENIIQTLNLGSYYWNTPKDIKPGSGYAIRISTIDNSIEHRFSIKRKVPLGYYGIPAGLAIILGVIVGSTGGSDDLPDAPLPN